MLLTAIYAILKKGEAYNLNICKREKSVSKSRALTIEQAVAFIRRHGYSVVDPDGVIAS
jgi:hypothetical protein